MGVFKNPRVLERLFERDGAWRGESDGRTTGHADARTAGKATADASGEEETEKSDGTEPVDRGIPWREPGVETRERSMGTVGWRETTRRGKVGRTNDGSDGKGRRRR